MFKRVHQIISLIYYKAQIIQGKSCRKGCCGKSCCGKNCCWKGCCRKSCCWKSCCWKSRKSFGEKRGLKTILSCKIRKLGSGKNKLDSSFRRRKIRKKREEKEESETRKSSRRWSVRVKAGKYLNPTDWSPNKASNRCETESRKQTIGNRE